MKPYYMVSLVKNGLLGGGLTTDDLAVTYRTGKVTVPPAYRNLVLRYSEIETASAARLFGLPTVTLSMRNGEEYRFAVFFGRTRLLDTLKAMGVETTL